MRAVKTVAAEKVAEGAAGARAPAAPVARGSTARRLRNWLRPSNIGAIYLWLVIAVIFAIWVPDLFLQADTARTILNVQAIAGLMALAIVLPLAAGVFDLSVAYTLGLANVLMSTLIMKSGLPVALAVVLGLLAGLAIGAINALVIVRFKISSFVATLGTSALIGAAITMVSDNLVTSVTGPIKRLASWQLLDISGPVYYMLALAVVLWYFLEHTVTGRHLYSIGFNPEAARLAGVPVGRLRAFTLLVSGTVAAFSGIIATAQTQSGTPTIGPPYLLPAFAAAFLGATQLRRGRFNAWGTVIAVLLLGTGTVGLSLAEAPVWASDVFVGCALLGSVGLTGLQRRGHA